MIIDSLQEARSKSKIAENTSDLDQESLKRKSRNYNAGTNNLEDDIPNPPIYIPDKNEIGMIYNLFIYYRICMLRVIQA